MAKNKTEKTNGTDSSTGTSERGQKKRTKEELTAEFSKMKEIAGLEGLSLSVDDNGRCTVIALKGETFQTVVGPIAGNTFIRLCEGAKVFGPYMNV